MHKLSITGIASVVLALSALPALALNTRTWISGGGTDAAGCGPITTPCRTLQYAHDQTTVGGEIDVLDPAGYGSIAITKAVSIINDGVGVAGVLAGAGGSAITIYGGDTDTVVLRGLTVEGNSLNGTSGILIYSSGRVDISNCNLQNLTVNGITLISSSGTPTVFLRNTSISNIAGTGLVLIPRGNAVTRLVADQVVAIDNDTGVYIDGSSSTGSTSAEISNSTASQNQSYGMRFAHAKVNVDLSHADQNGYYGYQYYKSSTGSVGRSIGSDNGFVGAWIDPDSTVQSTHDNRFFGNGVSAVSGALGVATLN